MVVGLHPVLIDKDEMDADTNLKSSLSLITVVYRGSMFVSGLLLNRNRAIAVLTVVIAQKLDEN